MATTGAKYPTVASTTSEAPYDHLTWIDPDNIKADDAADAYIDDADFDSGVESYVLKAKGFDFAAVPDGATILGITVKVEAYYTVGECGIALAQLLDVDGNKVGTNLASTPIPLTSGSPTIETIGAADNLWGNSLTAAWVKDADFGVALAVIPTGNNSNVYVDYVTMEVTYSLAPIERTIDDGIGITDAKTSLLDLIRTVSDSLGITDAKAVGQGLTISENLGLIDEIPLFLNHLNSYTYAEGENWPHAMIYLNGYIYVGLMTSPGKLLKIDADDLSSYSVCTFTDDGNHDQIIDAIYSVSKGKIYCLFAEYLRTVIVEVDPDTLEYTTVVDSSSYGCGQGSLTTDESYLYVGLFYDTDVIKIDMSDWSIDDIEDVIDEIHAIDYDGTNVYGTTNAGNVLQINPSDLEFTSNALGAGATIAPDEFAMTATHLYIGVETLTGKIYKVAKSDLSSVAIETGKALLVMAYFSMAHGYGFYLQAHQARLSESTLLQMIFLFTNSKQAIQMKWFLAAVIYLSPLIHIRLSCSNLNCLMILLVTSSAQ